GTRFVATSECLAHPRYKQALVDATETGTVVIERSIGRPGRVLRGPWAGHILEAEARGAGAEELLPLISGQVYRRAARDGELENGYVWSGQVAGLIHDLPPAGELIRRMVAGADEIIAGLAAGSFTTRSPGRQERDKRAE
ncbi:MAG TPA: nitronate monooxygenase, partial [Chloroflexota bacterium]